MTTNTNEIQRIIREYSKNLYFSKLENSEEMDKFLGVYDLPKSNQEDFKQIYREQWGWRSNEEWGVTAEFYQNFK
jgi:hypothetical protein